MSAEISEKLSQVPKVLVIDDDINHHQLISVSLKKYFTVVSELSGANAVNCAIAEKPDLIILDLQMPHVDGFEVLRQLKQHPVLAGIVIFCMSGSNSEESRERSSQLGATAFISKPINIKTYLSQYIQKT